jgi:hypothetical protein
MQKMDYDTLKAFLLNFWTRYLSSWALKGLAGFLVAHGGAAESSGAKAQAIIEGALALVVVGADFWHSRATTAANINTMPPNAVIHGTVPDPNTGIPTPIFTVPTK